MYYNMKYQVLYVRIWEYKSILKKYANIRSQN